MKYTEIIDQVKKKIFHPIYLLHGEEPFYIDLISDFIEENALDDSEKDFNQAILYGKDVTVDDIISQAKRFPMMSNYQVIIVKEAQNIDKLDELSTYIQKPQKSTILVLCHKHKKIDGRKQFFKLSKTNGVEFESPKIYENQVPAWIADFAKQKNYRIGSKACTMLSEFLGNDLSRVANELNKLFILTPNGSEITPDLIEKNIGISKDFNIFELTNQIGSRNIFKTFQIVNYFESTQKENPPQKIIPMLFDFFNKIMIYHFVEDRNPSNIAKEIGVNPFFLKDYTTAARNFPPGKTVQIFKYLREYDMRSKGVDDVGTDGGELIKELMTKIMYI